MKRSLIMWAIPILVLAWIAIMVNSIAKDGVHVEIHHPLDISITIGGEQ